MTETQTETQTKSEKPRSSYRTRRARRQALIWAVAAAAVALPYIDSDLVWVSQAVILGALVAENT